MAKWRRRSWQRQVFTAAAILLLALLIVVVRLVEDIGLDRQPGDRFLVASVVDGDTMVLNGGDRLRLLAIDTPEDGEPFYSEATDLLERLALSKMARLEYADKRRDKYGRLLAYLYIDNLFVNRAIIDSGLGYVYLFSDNELKSRQVAQLLSAQRSAIDRQVGLWSLDREPEPSYINLVGSFRLHRPTCRSVAKRQLGRFQEFATREAGLGTGLSPCRNCKP